MVDASKVLTDMNDASVKLLLADVDMTPIPILFAFARFAPGKAFHAEE